MNTDLFSFFQRMQRRRSLSVCELFAGVGGLRAGWEGDRRFGLSPTGFEVSFSDQWEPGSSRQWASQCYEHRWGGYGHRSVDIRTIPDDEFPSTWALLAGFPCQSYSIADKKCGRGLSDDRGALWWEVERAMRLGLPQFVLLENVGRILRTGAQRGQDWARILSSLDSLGYYVEWRVVDASEFGSAQRRKRIYVLCYHESSLLAKMMRADGGIAWMCDGGILARAFPAWMELDHCQYGTHADIGTQNFAAAGVMMRGAYVTGSPLPHRGASAVKTIAQILLPDVTEGYYLPDADLPRWQQLKGTKAQEGALSFPDPIDRPARTVLTEEGKRSPRRESHVIRDPQSGRLRLLTEVEVERLMGFPDNFTDVAGMPRSWRYRCMGNAVIPQIVHRIAQAVSTHLRTDELLSFTHSPTLTQEINTFQSQIEQRI